MPENKKNTKKLTELLARGVEEMVGRELLLKKLHKKEKMRIYLGVDPTGPQIHLGHAVILRKLREFQKLGHEIILLVGDFTARIGDPSDRKAARRPMTLEEIRANAKTYKQQAAKILDFSKATKNPARLEFNSRWLDALRFGEIIKIAQQFTVQRMLARDMFQERLKNGRAIYLNEFLYPVMQGYDSVAMQVDMEVGGSDQLFNMLLGRTMMANMLKKEKIVMAFSLLEGLDGRKMSKSYHNLIAVDDPAFEMYGKIMSLKDSLLLRYFELCTDVPEVELDKIKAKLANGANPRDSKMRLAGEIVKIYHSEEAAKEVEQEFIHRFRQKKEPTLMPEVSLKTVKWPIVDMLVEVQAAKTKSEARRLLVQGGVKLDGKKIMDLNVIVKISEDMVLQVGKRRFFRLKV